MRVSIILILILTFFGSCKKTEIKTRVIDSTSIIENDFNLSKLDKLSHFIPLETNSISLLSSISKMYFVGNYIYILDKEGGKGVFLFDRTGKFIRKIGVLGRGPGEYTSVDDFTIDKVNSVVYLLTDRKKIVLYDFNGKYIRNFNVDFFASKIEYNNTSNIIYFIGDDLGDNLIISDLYGKKLKGFFPNKEFGKHVRVLSNPFNNLDTLVLYRRFLDDNIYALKGDSLYIHYNINFGDDALSESKLEEILKLDSQQFKSNLQSYKCHVKYFVENDKKVLIFFYFNKMPHLCIYRKDIDKSETYSILKLHDDILHSESFPLIENVTDRSEFVFLVEPELLIRNIENINNDSIKNAVNAMIVDNSLKIDSNPIICILKNNEDE